MTPLAQFQVVEALARHTSYLHRASTAQVNRMTKVVDEVSWELLAELSERFDNLTEAERVAFSQGRYTTSRLKGIRNIIDKWSADISKQIDEAAKSGFRELAEHETEFARELVRNAVEGEFPPAPSGRQAYLRAINQPILGEKVQDMLNDIPAQTRRRVLSEIRRGFRAGETNASIIRSIRGTKALNYEDGILQATRNDVSRVVRTGRNHFSNEVYEETYEALGVEELVWVSTLDGRTSKICASRDGQRYKVGSNHPRPPAHPHCRSMLAPSFEGNIMGRRPYVRSLKVKGKFRSIGDMTEKQRREAKLDVGQVSAQTNYSSWFERQPASFQKEWLGPKRYKLYRDGNYPLSKFVDPLKGELTLDELRRRDRATFDELFGDAA